MSIIIMKEGEEDLYFSHSGEICIILYYWTEKVATDT